MIFQGFIYIPVVLGISKNESTTFCIPKKTPLAQIPQAKRCCWKVDIKTSGCQWWLIRTQRGGADGIPGHPRIYHFNATQPHPRNKGRI